MSGRADAPRGYAASHPVIRLSSKRFQFSPWASCYSTPETVWGLYSGRFYALGWGDDPVPKYEALRRDAVLFDVPERPIEISGPQALDLLKRVFSRRIDDLAVGRGRYCIACRDDGGILMDGVLFHCEATRWWYVPANGEFLPWLHALAIGLDVQIRDPSSWVLQVQGPRSIEVLGALWDADAARALPYFHIRQCRIAGKPFLVSRTGWTGEMGFELYTLEPHIDGPALWNHLLETGRPFGLVASSLESMGIRRIEAGILDNGTDIDPSLTPWQAGLGKFVDLDAGDFVGRTALAAADRTVLLHGILADETPVAGTPLHLEGRRIGWITTGAYSPHLRRGVGYARFIEPRSWLGTMIGIGDVDSARPLTGRIVPLPFYDPDKRIPRGLPTA